MVNNSCFRCGKMKLMRQIFKLNVQQAPLTNLRSAIEKLSYWLADLSGKDIKSCSHDTGKNSLQNNVYEVKSRTRQTKQQISSKGTMSCSILQYVHFNVITMCFITAIFLYFPLVCTLFLQKRLFQFGAISHLFERLFLISWENNRDCHTTMPLSLKTMEVIKGDQ